MTNFKMVRILLSVSVLSLIVRPAHGQEATPAPLLATAPALAPAPATPPIPETMPQVIIGGYNSQTNCTPIDMGSPFGLLDKIAVQVSAFIVGKASGLTVLKILQTQVVAGQNVIALFSSGDKYLGVSAFIPLSASEKPIEINKFVYSPQIDEVKSGIGLSSITEANLECKASQFPPTKPEETKPRRFTRNRIIYYDQPGFNGVSETTVEYQTGANGSQSIQANQQFNYGSAGKNLTNNAPGISQTLILGKPTSNYSSGDLEKDFGAKGVLVNQWLEDKLDKAGLGTQNNPILLTPGVPGWTGPSSVIGQNNQLVYRSNLNLGNNPIGGSTPGLVWNNWMSPLPRNWNPFGPTTVPTLSQSFGSLPTSSAAPFPFVNGPLLGGQNKVITQIIGDALRD